MINVRTHLTLIGLVAVERSLGLLYLSSQAICPLLEEDKGPQDGVDILFCRVNTTMSPLWFNKDIASYKMFFSLSLINSILG